MFCKEVRFVLCLLWLVSCCYGLGERQHGLHAKLAHKQLLRGDEGSTTSQALFEFTLSNPSSKPVSFLKWGTPMESPLLGSMFQVINTQTGKVIPYNGIIVDRLLPNRFEEAKEYFITLQPGLSVSSVIDLSQYYDLSSPVVLHPTTTFEVRLDSNLNFFVGNHEIISLFNNPESYLSFAPLESESVQLTVTTATQPAIRNHVSSILAGGGYTNCTNSQIAEGNRLVPPAQALNNVAYNYLTTFRCDLPYVTWFGAFESTRVASVKNGIGNIKKTWDEKTYSIMCTNVPPCGPTTFGWVGTADKTHVIHLCPFWFTFKDDIRKMHTLNHELSHFNDIAATRDHVYGEANCLNLAKTDPSKAILCAANYGYFITSDIKC